MHLLPRLLSRLPAIVLTFLVLAIVPDESAAQSREMLESPYAWAGAGVAIAGTILLDPWLFRQLRADGVEDRHPLTRAGNALGNGEWMAAGLAGSYLVTRVAGQERAYVPLGRTFAGLVAAGVVNGTVKWGVGRERPGRGNEDHLHFEPFNMEDRWQSFPSGHVVTAFAVATAVSIEADRSWVTALTYGTAGLVAWSRLHEERHWASDTVAGAVSGSAASALMVHWLRDRARGAESLQLVVGPEFISVSIPTR